MGRKAVKGMIDPFWDDCSKKKYETPVIEETARQVNCSHCDYLNFSEKIIDIIVEVMTKYGIESVEDLQRELDRLRGGEGNE